MSAFGAAMLYRLATFYLPPAWGFFAMRWLQRNQHLSRSGSAEPGRPQRS